MSCCSLCCCVGFVLFLYALPLPLLLSLFAFAFVLWLVSYCYVSVSVYVLFLFICGICYSFCVVTVSVHVPALFRSSLFSDWPLSMLCCCSVSVLFQDLFDDVLFSFPDCTTPFVLRRLFVLRVSFCVFLLVLFVVYVCLFHL